MIAVAGRIALGRARLHDAITEYTTLVQYFPANSFAEVTGFRAEL